MGNGNSGKWRTRLFFKNTEKECLTSLVRLEPFLQASKERIMGKGHGGNASSGPFLSQSGSLVTLSLSQNSVANLFDKIFVGLLKRFSHRGRYYFFSCIFV